MPERRACRGVPRQGEPSDDLILAALERAELHDGRPDDPAVLYAAVVDHLGLKMGSSTGYWFRPRFRALEDVGLVTSAKRNGLIVHALTGAARQRLRSARAADRLGELPESPQHRRWREARAEAAERIGEYRWGGRASTWARRRTASASGRSRATTPPTLTTVRAAGDATHAPRPGRPAPPAAPVKRGRESANERS